LGKGKRQVKGVSRRTIKAFILAEGMCWKRTLTTKFAQEREKKGVDEKWETRR